MKIQLTLILSSSLITNDIAAMKHGIHRVRSTMSEIVINIRQALLKGESYDLIVLAAGMKIKPLFIVNRIFKIIRERSTGEFIFPPDSLSDATVKKYQYTPLAQGEKGTNLQISTANIKKESFAPLNIEEALHLTKFGKFNYVLVAVTGISLAAVLIEMIGISFVLPVSECDLSLTTKDKGVLSGVGFVGIIASSFLWGYLADTKGRHIVIKWSLLLAFISSVASSFSNDFWSLLILRFLTGFFVSGGYGPAFAYIGEFHTEKTRSRAIMYASIILGLFTLVLPLVAWLVINQDWIFDFPAIQFTYKPWRLFIVGCSTLSLVAFLIMCILPESPKFVLNDGNIVGAIEIIKKMHRWNCGKNADLDHIYGLSDETASDHEQDVRKRTLFASIWLQIKPLFLPPHLRTTMLMCILKFIEFAGTNGLYVWIPEVLNRLAKNDVDYPGERIRMCDVVYRYRPNITYTDKSIVFSPESCIIKFEIATYEQTLLLEIFYTLSFVIQALLINRIGKFPLLFGITVIATITSISAMYVEVPKLSAYFYMLQILIGTTDSILNAVIVELYPTNVRATAMAIGSVSGRLGSVVFAYVVGLLLDYHCSEAVVMTFVLYILCAFLEIFIPNIHKRPKKKTVSPVSE